MNSLLATLALAACGTSGGSAPTGISGCNAELSGNVVESSWSEKNCPVLVAAQGDTLLQFELPSKALRGNVAITVDLGRAPTPGAFNSGTTERWSATGTKLAGACVFDAGNHPTPTGDFVLDLSAIDRTTAHGTLSLHMVVLPGASNDGSACGSGTTEQLQLRF